MSRTYYHLHRPIRHVKIVELNSMHARISLFDQSGANIGFLCCSAEDLCMLIHQITPKLLSKTEDVVLPADWKDPQGVQWR